MRRGLVVGKFMPFHKGHQLLVETALAQVDELTVVVYDTPVPDVEMPVEMRAGWVSALYPNLHAIVTHPDPLYEEAKFMQGVLNTGTGATHFDHTAGDDPKYRQVYADDVRYLGPFTHVFSSEDYGPGFAEALGATHVMVDAARNLMPISGTKFRDNMYEYRAFVNPLVYLSLIQKVVFMGTESVGKSTLVKALAEKHKTLYTHEYGRSLWEEYQELGVEPPFAGLWRVGKTQYEQEQAVALHANRFLFCDTNALTTVHWSQLLHGHVDARLEALAESTKNEYTYFIVHPDFPWVDDGTRSLDNNKSIDFHHDIQDDLKRRGIRSVTISGSVEQRVAQVERHLKIPAGVT
jgi:HTH-type transcriptional repressor of NAD biosynthesis genes